MKKIKFLSILALLIMLTGCADVESVSDQQKPDNTSMFVLIETTTTWCVVYHKETKVMYTVSRGSYNSGDFTVLLNADGTPMLWEEN